MSNTELVNENIEHLEMVPSEPNAIEQITRGEIDIQIATAKKYPRSMQLFKQRSIEMVTMDEDTAASCIYSRPVGKGADGQQTYAEGMSVRMAEIVGATYGNLRAQAMIVSQTNRQVVARGIAHDLETNFAASTEVIESTVNSKGQAYSERMRVTVAKAALAKARRDAIFQVVPKALCKHLETAAKNLISGSGQAFEVRRSKAITWLKSLKIDLKRVWEALGIKGEADINGDHLILLTGIKNAIIAGDTTADEAFPDDAKREALTKPLGEEMRKMAESEKKKG